MWYNNAFINTGLKERIWKTYTLVVRQTYGQHRKSSSISMTRFLTLKQMYVPIKKNAKCVKFFTQEDDGLSQEWKGVCWMNPPYGRDIGKWMKKAYESSLEGATVVCLVPSRTDTKWRHDYSMKGEIEFIKGRLKFGGGKNSALFPSAVVVFKGGLNGK